MWIIAGAIALIAVIINMVLVFTGRHKYCVVLVWISLSSGLVAMLSQYSMITSWVKANDMSALMDVVPTMNTVLIVVVFVGIVLNAIAVAVHYRNRKELN